MGDEISIDIRQYLNALVRRWRLIVMLGLVTGAASLLLALISPPGYEAAAGIAIVKKVTDIEFDSRFKTLSGDIVGTGYAQAMGAEARRSALASLVKNGAIAEQVITEMADQIDEPERKPAALLRTVESEVVDKGDLIRIKVKNADPNKAAAIANAWARIYERQINSIYGGAPIGQTSSVSTELEQAQKDYDQAQAAMEAFIAQNQIDKMERSIAEKKHVINTLQASKQTAITALIDEETSLRTKVIKEYLDAQTSSRLLAFQKEQSAKRELLSAYIDTEIQTRVALFNRDHSARANIFDQYVEAETKGQLAVLSEQIAQKRQDLSSYYATKTRTERLLDIAQTMRSQLVQGGDAAARSNELALLLLKAQAFSTSSELPVGLQMQLNNQTFSTAGQQIADLDGLIAALQTQLKTTEDNIQQLSKDLLAGTGYNFLEDVSAANLTLSSIMTTSSASSTAPASRPVTGTLSAYIKARYKELFAVSDMAQAAQTVATDTPLFAEIGQLYPDLFTLDQYTQLTEAIPPDNALATAAGKKSQELLQLDYMESLPDYLATEGPLTQTIDELQNEIQSMQSELEQQSSKRQGLEQKRNLAWETYTTLARKQSEVGLADSITGSEVRFAAPAVPPISRTRSRVTQVLIATSLGGLLGCMLVLAIEYMADGKTWLVLWGQPSAFWNRAWTWLMDEKHGQPYQADSDDGQ